MSTMFPSAINDFNEMATLFSNLNFDVVHSVLKVIYIIIWIFCNIQHDWKDIFNAPLINGFYGFIMNVFACFRSFGLFSATCWVFLAAILAILAAIF